MMFARFRFIGDYVGLTRCAFASFKSAFGWLTEHAKGGSYVKVTHGFSHFLGVVKVTFGAAVHTHLNEATV